MNAEPWGVMFGGILVEVDEDLPPGTLEIRSGTETVQIVNIGEDEPEEAP